MRQKDLRTRVAEVEAEVQSSKGVASDFLRAKQEKADDITLLVFTFYILFLAALPFILVAISG